MSYEEEMNPLRTEIDRINAEIIGKLAERVEVALKIGEVKRSYGRPVVDMGREGRVYGQARSIANERGIDPDGVERVFREIVRLCTEVQREGRR
jgi:chorismate mutase